MIDDIINGIDEGGPKSYYSFETFVQHLLKHHIEKQEKKLLISTDLMKYGDAFAPSGFDQFEGPTIIEVKFNLNRVPVRLFIERMVYRLLNEYTENNFKNVLFISARPISEKFISRVEDELIRDNLPFKISF